MPSRQAVLLRPEAVSHMATKAPEAPTRDQLITALRIANDAAKECRDKRSPAAAVAHEDINALLDELVGA